MTDAGLVERLRSPVDQYGAPPDRDSVAAADLIEQLCAALVTAQVFAACWATTYKIQHELKETHQTHQQCLDEIAAALVAGGKA